MKNERTGNGLKVKISPVEVLKKILIFIALVAVTTVTLRPLQISVQNKMEKLRDSFISSAEEYWGRKFLYGSIGPSIFGVLDIRNVLVLREDDSVFLSISRLRLSYSLFELLSKKNLNAFHSMRIDRPVLSLDFVKDADLKERLGAFGNGKAADGIQEERQNGERLFPAGSFLPENFSLRIWNGEWELWDSIGSVKLTGVGLEASINQNNTVFQGRWNADASMSGWKGIVMAGRFNGEYSDTLNEGKALVSIPSCYGSNFRLRPLTINLLLTGSKFEARMAEFSLVYDLNESRLQGLFEADNFAPETLLVFTDTWKDRSQFLATAITGSASFTREGSGTLDYSVDLSGTGPLIPDMETASMALKLSGDLDRIKVDNLALSSSSYGELKFSGGMDFKLIAPYGTLSLSDFRISEGAGSNRIRGISGDIFINTREQNIRLFGENISAGAVVLSALDADFYQEEEGFSFFFSALKSGSAAYQPEQMNTISLEGSVDYGPVDYRHLRASLRLDSFFIGDILAFVEPLLSLNVLPSPVRDALDDLSLTTEVFFTTDYEHLLFNAPRLEAAYEGLAGFLLDASISGTDRGFELTDGRIAWNKESADISCSVDFSDPGDISFSFNTVYRDLTYFFEGMILDQKNVSIRGSYGFQAFFGTDWAGAYSGYAQGDNIPFSSGERLASLNFLFSGLYFSPASWQAQIEKFEITGMTTPASSFVSLRFTGAANENGINIPDLFYDDGLGALAGNINLDWDSTFSYCSFKTDIFAANRNEYYDLAGVYRDKRLEFSLNGTGMQLGRISSLNAVADAKLKFSWESFSAFEAEAELSSLVLNRPQGQVHVSAMADLNSGFCQIRELNINYFGLEASLPYLRISRTEARAETECFIQGNLSGRVIDFALRGEAGFNPAETWLDLYRDFSFLDGSVSVDVARYDTMEAQEPFKFVFNSIRENKVLSVNLNGGPRNMLRLRYTADDAGGNFFAALSAPSPVRGSLTGSITSDYIDAQGTDLYVDMGSLWRFVPPSVDVVAFPGGVVTGSIRIVGPLEEPEFYGSVVATSLQIVVPDFLPEPIRPVPTTIHLTGGEMSFGPTTAIVGRGAGKASAWFRFDQWIPNIFNIDIQVPSETPIPHDFDVSGVLAHGLVSGRLILSMENLILTVFGDLTAHDTEISLDSTEMAASESNGSSESDSTVTTVTDISIRAGRRVEFFWPRAEFPILQAYADMGTGIRLTSDGATNRFTFTGDVRLRSGEIFYLERNFYIREGTLFFNESEVQFDPRISARAEMRDHTEDGPVTISLIIDNAPLMSFTPRFESSPPLSQLEIYSLLGQNPEGGAVAGQRNIATSAVIDSLAQFTVIRRLQRQIRDFMGLDMFSVRTQLIQNVVLQVGRDQTAETNVDKPYRVGNYFDNTTVFIGKYFGPEIFGEAMLSIKYDENKINWGGLVLEPEIGLELRNPLFNIRFNMVPLHPENWFINDTSISLIWRRTFR